MLKATLFCEELCLLNTALCSAASQVLKLPEQVPDQDAGRNAPPHDLVTLRTQPTTHRHPCRPQLDWLPIRFRLRTRPLAADAPSLIPTTYTLSTYCSLLQSKSSRFGPPSHSSSLLLDQYRVFIDMSTDVFGQVFRALPMYNPLRLTSSGPRCAAEALDHACMPKSCRKGTDSKRPNARLSGCLMVDRYHRGPTQSFARQCEHPYHNLK